MTILRMTSGYNHFTSRERLGLSQRLSENIKDVSCTCSLRSPWHHSLSCGSWLRSTEKTITRSHRRTNSNTSLKPHCTRVFLLLLLGVLGRTIMPASDRYCQALALAVNRSEGPNDEEVPSRSKLRAFLPLSCSNIRRSVPPPTTATLLLLLRGRRNAGPYTSRARIEGADAVALIDAITSKLLRDNKILVDSGSLIFRG